MRLFFLIFFLCGSSLSVFSVEIVAEHPDYSHKVLQFFTPGDPVSGEKELLFTLQFNEQGKATTNINSNKTIYSFAEFGIYKAMLFIESGSRIELKMPPFREKSFVDKKNPYFSPVSFWLATLNPEQLNVKVSAFDAQLNREIDKNFNALYYRQSMAAFDTILFSLNKAHPTIAENSFYFHKQHRLQQNRTIIFKQTPKASAKIVNQTATAYWLHPAFMSLLDNLYGKQLSFLANSISGKPIKDAVQSQNLSELTKHTTQKFQLIGEVAQLVLLKMLHDAYYSGDFSKHAVKGLVQQAEFTNSNNPLIKITAQNLLSKFSFLEKGQKAPKICLKDLSAKEYCTSDRSDKFKYIVFADADMVVCQEHLKYLEKIDERFQQHLEIFVVLRYTEREFINQFFTKNNIPGKIVIDENNQTIKQYKVRSFPQCFLLDENHKVVFENTKAPLDGFEQQFGNWLRNELFMRQRNQQ
jgi:peroxiredoxin